METPTTQSTLETPPPTKRVEVKYRITEEQKAALRARKPKLASFNGAGAPKDGGSATVEQNAARTLSEGEAVQPSNTEE